MDIIKQISLLDRMGAFSINGSQNTKDLLDADRKALEIYLQMGYSKSDTLATFCSIFKKCKANEKRYKIIKDYIEKFENNQKP